MATTKNHPNLLPCPFCGGTDLNDQDWWGDDGDMDAIECRTCLASAPAQIWNLRPGLRTAPDMPTWATRYLEHQDSDPATERLKEQLWQDAADRQEEQS